MMELVNKKIPEAPQYDGGTTIIDRFKMVFGVSTMGSIDRLHRFFHWQHVNMAKPEIQHRLRLYAVSAWLLGARLEWLLFGRGEMYEDQQAVKTGIKLIKTENGKVASEGEFSLQQLEFPKACRI